MEKLYWELLNCIIKFFWSPKEHKIGISQGMLILTHGQFEFLLVMAFTAEN